MFRLLHKVFGRCAHQFSWPRKASDGSYYQVCLRCSSQYAYDWETMHRLGRIEARPARIEPDQPARRMSVAMKARYREVGSETWHEATTENMSQTGVKLQAVPVLRENTPVEVVLDMPEQITGTPNSKVVCNGHVVRTITSAKNEPGPGFAVRLRDYRYSERQTAPQTNPELSLQR
jgi:hypothetical protein